MTISMHYVMSSYLFRISVKHSIILTLHTIPLCWYFCIASLVVYHYLCVWQFYVLSVKLSSAVLRLAHANASTASFYVMNANDRLLKEVWEITKVELKAFLFLWDRVGCMNRNVEQTYSPHISEPSSLWKQDRPQHPWKPTSSVSSNSSYILIMYVRFIQKPTTF